MEASVFCLSISFISTTSSSETNTNGAFFRFTVEWEGPDAVEECVDDGAMVVQRRKAARARMQRPDIKFEPEESEEEASSEDEYVAEDSQSTGRFRHANKVGHDVSSPQSWTNLFTPSHSVKSVRIRHRTRIWLRLTIKELLNVVASPTSPFPLALPPRFSGRGRQLMRPM